MRLLRAVKTMARGLKGGTSFMEDYTYHLDPANPLVLGSHMLEICESIADGKPSLEVHPLGIGGKADPVRLVFNAPAGPAINASLIDLGNRFRLIVNEVDAITPPQPLPKLPVARAVWKCRPDFKTACASWIYAGAPITRFTVMPRRRSICATSPRSPASRWSPSTPALTSRASVRHCGTTKFITT